MFQKNLIFAFLVSASFADSIPHAEESCLSEGAARIDSIISAIEHSLAYTKYTHQARIDVKKGIYAWDCSIMATWIIKQSAPHARRALAKEKPLARDFYRTIMAADTCVPRNGWQRITKPSALAPGDVFAWLQPEIFKERGSTGHVGFIIAKPWRHKLFSSVWVMRIADATLELHGNDSRPAGGDGGFGTATIAILCNDQGAPTAYGWYGESQDTATFVPTSIVFGRVYKDTPLKTH